MEEPTHVEPWSDAHRGANARRLGYVGLDPGQGLGSQLVEMGTSRADDAGVPCYLETGTDSDIAFYRKRGFEVVGQADCYGYTLTGMIRPPR